MPARRPASGDLTKKTVPYYSTQRSLYWPFCLFNSETCLVFDWFYSNYYCLWSTITTPHMLSLEMNESSDLSAFNSTTLKWKLPEKIKVSEFEPLIWNKSPRRAPILRFPILKRCFARPAAEPPCADVYERTWKSSRALSPLFNKPLQNANTKNMHSGGVQTNTHAERDRNDDNALRSKWPQPANASMFFYSNSTSISMKKKNVFFSRCSPFSSQIKTALKSKWSSSISVSEALINKYRQAVVWREKSWVHVLGGD